MQCALGRVYPPQSTLHNYRMIVLLVLPWSHQVIAVYTFSV